MGRTGPYRVFLPLRKQSLGVFAQHVAGSLCNAADVPVARQRHETVVPAGGQRLTVEARALQPTELAHQQRSSRRVEHCDTQDGG